MAEAAPALAARTPTLFERLRRAADTPAVLGPLLAAPAVGLLAALVAYPLVFGVWLGLTSATLGNAGHFVGLANFTALFADPTYRAATFYSILYTVGSEALKLSIGLALAMVLNQRFRGYRAARSLMLLPWVAPTVLAVLAWQWLLDPQFSGISWLFERLGLIHHAINFLGTEWNARVSLIVVNVWRGVPYFAIGFMAGLQSIPAELLEAAAIDGAGGWASFRHIIWPLLAPLTTILVCFSSIWTITDFQLIWTMTQGGPVNGTQVFTTLAYQRAIPSGNLGQGAAIAISTLPFMIVLAYFALRAMREK
ncbi:sugar ABC transporter permease [bacterium]|nr:MAG: sugar ABC transporter permease [bacterium]